MNKKLLKTICGLFIVTLALSGCTASLKEENSALSREIALLKVKNADLESKISDLDNKLKEQQYVFESSSKPAFRNSDNIYPIYTADINTYEVEEDAYIYIAKETSLKKKLDILAKALSEAYFNSLPIKVVRVEEVNNKKIAVVNLEEAAENKGKTDPKDTKGKTWAFDYMQGSTGGTITETQLIETMLQRKYKGQWVDGVKFLYQGGVCAYEHAYSLKDINYRD